MGLRAKWIPGVLAVVVSGAMALAFAAAGPAIVALDPQGLSGGTPGPTDGGTADPTIQPGRDCGPSKDLTGREKSWNAHFMNWLIHERVIHVLPGAFEGDETHDVHANEKLLVGFEFTGASVESLDEDITNNPNFGIRGVLDGTVVADDWGQYIQPPFVAETECGAAWSWDHDGDGPGDGNGNGIGDFDGPVLFWRAPLGPLPTGTYVLEVELTFDGVDWFPIPGGTIVVR